MGKKLVSWVLCSCGLCSVVVIVVFIFIFVTIIIATVFIAIIAMMPQCPLPLPAPSQPLSSPPFDLFNLQQDNCVRTWERNIFRFRMITTG